MAESLANDNTTCVVCFKNVVYYSIGECDHPVCFECSTRMRVLCLQNECPICRQALSRVVFTDTVHPYKELRMRVLPDRLFERQFKIGFSSEEIKQAYEHLLVNRCKLCENIPPFRTFSQLSDHMRKTHERYYCDLCVKHLKIFTSERRCYTRQELAHHRRKGDLDDTSHRGHPLCEFCEERFMDADELYRHLRKEHLYCHLCDADGRNLYYASHSALAHHFRTDHFLCEEGDCAGNHLTAVFRTEIDLKAHKATVHGRGMTRGAARQARTLELQFNITPHSAQLVHAQRTPRDHRQQEAREPSPPPPPVPSPRIDTRSDEQFPRLSAAQPTTGLMLGGPNKAYKGMDGLTRNERNFPTLGGGAGGGGAVPPAGPSRPAPSVAAAILRNSKPAVSIQVHSQPASASNFRLTQTSGNRISIPQQQQQTSGKQPRRQPLCDDDFPSLGGKDVPKDDYPSLGAATMQPPKGFWPKKEPNGIVALANLRPQNFLQGMWEEMPLPRKGASETLRKSSGKGEKANDDDSDEMQALKSGPPSAQKKPTLSSESFPALSAAAAPAGPPPRWITVSKDKPKKAPKQPEPAPPPREPAFNQVADFPTLPVNTKAKKKSPQTQVQTNKTQAQAQINKQFQVQAHPPPSINHQSEPKQPSKKEKKKQNNNNQNNEKKDDSDPPTPTYVNGFTDKLTKQQIKEAYTAAMSLNDNPTDVDKKIKTIEDGSSTEKRRNGGNGDFAFAPQDYPPLSGKSGSNSTPPAPVQPSKRVNGSVVAPPGFSVAARAQCGGMTFTNSAGQTFPAPLHSYIPPPDFERRNRALVKRFTEALGSAAAVENFKVASRAYRDNILCAEEFYEHCRRAMGSQLDAVFPDLVALLPDIAKQQELVVGRDIASKLEVCSICGQLISPDDRIAHDTAHWPPLTH